MPDNKSAPDDVIAQLEKRFQIRAHETRMHNIVYEHFPDEGYRDEGRVAQIIGPSNGRGIRAFVYITQTAKISTSSIVDAFLTASDTGVNHSRPAIVRCIYESRDAVVVDVFIPCGCYYGLGEIVKAFEASEAGRKLEKVTLLVFNEHASYRRALQPRA